MPRGAAELIVQFVADTSKLDAGVSKVQQSGGKLSGFAKKAGTAIAGGFAAGAVLNFGKASVTAAQESEQATNRLQQVFKSMGDETGNAAKAAENYASTLSKQIGVDDEVIKGAQAKLATFKDVSSETARQSGIFDRATSAAADLAAAGFGTMDSNAVQLGKALQDPTKGLAALARSGVTFTDQQKESIKAMTASGDKLGAQKAILKAVEGQVKGTAKATATDSEKMTVAFGEVQEQVGTALMPAFKGLSDILLNSVIPAVQSVIGFIQENITWLGPLAAMIGTVVAVLKLWSITQGILNAVMAANPIVLVVAAIAALVAGVIIAYQKVDWFRAAVQVMGRAAVAAFKFLKAAALAVFNWIKSHWPLLLSILGGPIGLAATLVIKHWNTIKSAAVSLFTTVSGWFRRIVGVVRGAVSGIGSAAAAIGRAFARIGHGAMEAVQAVARWMGSIVDKVRGVIGAVTGAASGIANAIKGPINAVISAWNSLRVPGFKFHIDPPGPGPTFDFNWSGVDLPNIPKLAAGGVLSGPTLFMGGEAGTEIVTPEALMRRVVREEGGRAPVVAQLNVTTWDPPAVAHAVANELAYLEMRRRP